MPSFDSSVFASEDFNAMPVDTASIAVRMTAWSERIRPHVAKGLRGFEATRGDEGFRICVSDDGLTVHHEMKMGSKWFPDEDESFGVTLHRFGLSSLPTSGEASGTIADTLERLSAQGLVVMRSVPGFSTSSFGAAARMSPNAPFIRMVRRLPALASELEYYVHDVRSEDGGHISRGEGGSLRDTMILGDGDPLDAYVEIVREFAGEKWDGIELDPVRIRHVAETAGKVVALEDLGLLPWHVAFFATGPDEAIPSTPVQMAAAIRFVERYTTLFSSIVGMSPDDFHAEFGSLHRYDWTKLSEAAKTLKVGSFLYSSDIGDPVLRALGEECGFDAEPFLDRTFSNDVGHVLIRACAVGRGFVGLFGSYGAWIRSIADEDDNGFQAMSSSGFLPEGLRFGTATELLEHLGMDVDQILAGLSSGEDFSLESLGTSPGGP